MEDNFLTTEGLKPSTYSELTFEDLETIIAGLEKDHQCPEKPQMHLTEQSIKFWHQEGLMQAILKSTDIYVNSAGHDLLIELGYIKLKDAGTDKKS